MPHFHVSNNASENEQFSTGLSLDLDFGLEKKKRSTFNIPTTDLVLQEMWHIPGSVDQIISLSKNIQLSFI